MIKAFISRAGYGDKISIVENISFKVEDGEALLITGKVGSGKTTLLLALTGVLNNLLDGFVEGCVRINDLDPLKPHGFTKIPYEVGFVLQDPDKQIAMPTPMDEILFTLENLGYDYHEATKLAEEGLKQIGLYEKAYNHVETLSFGEKRKLTFSASTIHNPPILMLDEPTASMDPYGVAITRRFIRRARRSGLSVIVIEHKPEYFVDLVDRVMLIEGKSLVEADGQGGNYARVLYERLVSNRDMRVSSKSGDGAKLLKLENISIGYTEPLISEIDMEIREGRVIGIVGRNGCGKTTLLKAIAGFLKPLEGSIERFSNAFYVPQQPDYVFVSNTVYEELRLLEKKTGFKLSETRLSREWIEKSLFKSPFKLSHGQRRLLSLIIALAYKSRIILLDEPTTGLDNDSVNMLVENISTLREKGYALVIATHDPRLIPFMDEIYLIDRGLIKNVDHEEILKWFINASME